MKNSPFIYSFIHFILFTRSTFGDAASRYRTRPFSFHLDMFNDIICISSCILLNIYQIKIFQPKSCTQKLNTLYIQYTFSLSLTVLRIIKQKAYYEYIFLICIFNGQPWPPQHNQCWRAPLLDCVKIRPVSFFLCNFLL
jgi:hypothetical protein